MKIETTGLQDFQKALKAYELASSKTREEVLRHRARNFAFALFREYQKAGAQAKRSIKALPAKVMKVRTGNRSRAQEKARRIFAAGFVATGWIPALQKIAGKGTLRALANVKSPQGRVVFGKDYIEIINSTPGAAEADAKHGLTDRAFRNQAEDMEKYLRRKAEKDLERSFR